MLSFLKSKREFGEFVNKERFEKILEKYVEPKLSELGFTWTKEKRHNETVLEYLRTEWRRPLLEHEEFIAHNFERKRGDVVDAIVISRQEFKGRLTFYSNWEIASAAYEDWHMKTYGEEVTNFNLHGWSDLDDIRIDKKYRKKRTVVYEYDLSRYTTDEVMHHFLEQMFTIRLPELEQYKSLNDLVLLLESFNDPNVYEVMFDFYMMEDQHDKAGRVLIWAERSLDPKKEYLNKDEDFLKRLNLIKKVLQK
ncbi:MAG: hypothetical protein ACI8ZM_003989 [Crocinitomix sp.]|jgi:hypothetical protein